MVERQAEGEGEELEAEEHKDKAVPQGLPKDRGRGDGASNTKGQEVHLDDQDQE